MRTEFFNKFLRDITKLLDDSDDYNVKLEIGEGPDARFFWAHSIILRTRCPFFNRALSETWAKKTDTGLFTLKKPNITPSTFKLLLSYFYTGDLQINNSVEAIDLLIAADELDLEELFEYIQSFLIENEADWIDNHLVKVYQIASQIYACKELEESCHRRLEHSPDLMLISNDFRSIEKEKLIELLQTNAFAMKEVELFEKVMQWGISQNPELDEDMSVWDDSDWNALRESVKLCLLHIRWARISGAEYSEKVKQYKKAFPANIRMALQTHFAITKRVSPLAAVSSSFLGGGERKRSKYQQYQERSLESNIIKAEHAVLISCWIDQFPGDDSFYQHTVRKFDLLYRASDDGYERSTFDEKCLKEETLILWKIQENGHIIGGYCEKGFSNVRLTYPDTDSTCFLFSLNDGKNLRKASYIPLKTFDDLTSGFLSSLANKYNMHLGDSTFSMWETAGTLKFSFCNKLTIQDCEVFSLKKV